MPEDEMVDGITDSMYMSLGELRELVKDREAWRARKESDMTEQLSTYLVKNILPSSSKFNSLEGVMLKLKLQHFGHLMQRADSFEKTLRLGKIEGRRRRGRWENKMVGWHH